MAFKRALWTSGYTYVISCPYCGTQVSYVDRQLDYRPWYPNGFIYCPRCRKPLRHSEIYAVHPDGTRVYNNMAEAEQAINLGYLNAVGVNQPPVQSTAQPVQPPAPSPGPQGESFCPRCGRGYVPGRDHFCADCGTKLNGFRIE